jgi:hypothetical protein
MTVAGHRTPLLPVRAPLRAVGPAESRAGGRTSRPGICGEDRPCRMVIREVVDEAFEPGESFGRQRGLTKPARRPQWSHDIISPIASAARSRSGGAVPVRQGWRQGTVARNVGGSNAISKRGPNLGGQFGVEQTSGRTVMVFADPMVPPKIGSEFVGEAAPAHRSGAICCTPRARIVGRCRDGPEGVGDRADTGALGEPRRPARQ